jgi:RimJ/RimL family protein N-acetyltransferase
MNLGGESVRLKSAEAVRLRPVEAGDWPLFLRLWADARVLRLNPGPALDIISAQAAVRRLLAEAGASPPQSYAFIIMVSAEPESCDETGIPGGVTCLRPDAARHSCELGVHILPELWGAGLATWSAARMIEIALDELNFEAVTARCLEVNLASARVMEKIGLRMDKRLPRAAYHCGRWQDVLVYQLVKAWR